MMPKLTDLLKTNRASAGQYEPSTPINEVSQESPDSKMSAATGSPDPSAMRSDTNEGSNGKFTMRLGKTELQSSSSSDEDSEE